jgi:hypothetical protein
VPVRRAPASNPKASVDARPTFVRVRHPDFVHQPRFRKSGIVIVGRGPQKQWLRLLVRTKTGKTVAERWTLPNWRGRVERRLALPNWLRRPALRVILMSRVGESYRFARTTVYVPRRLLAR